MPITPNDFDPFGLQAKGAKVALASSTSENCERLQIQVSRSSSDGKRQQQIVKVSRSTSEIKACTSSAQGSASIDDFDPFGLGSAHGSEEEEREENDSNDLHDPPQLSRVTRDGASPLKRRSSSALPPKMLVKLLTHEEVASVADQSADAEGASEVFIEGTIFAQVTCSDAWKNAPFVARSPDLLQLTKENAPFQANPKFSHPIKGMESRVLVKIPKTEVGFVPIASYSIRDTIHHMPILLERKVSVVDRSCRIAVQVRSKLTNAGDLEDFTIAVAIPEQVNPASIKILRGNGVWDDLKRLVKWKLEFLNKGESFMVSAQADLWDTIDTTVQELNFPVIMRCSSTMEQISNTGVVVEEAEGHPAALTYSRSQGFRLLHRLT